MRLHWRRWGRPQVSSRSGHFRSWGICCNSPQWLIIMFWDIPFFHIDLHLPPPTRSLFRGFQILYGNSQTAETISSNYFIGFSTFSLHFWTSAYGNDALDQHPNLKFPCSTHSIALVTHRSVKNTFVFKEYREIKSLITYYKNKLFWWFINNLKSGGNSSNFPSSESWKLHSFLLY